MSWTVRSIPAELPSYTLTGPTRFEVSGVNERPWPTRLAGWTIGALIGAGSVWGARELITRTDALAGITGTNLTVIKGIGVALALAYLIFVIAASGALVQRRVHGKAKWRQVVVPSRLLDAGDATLRWLLVGAHSGSGQMRAAAIANHEPIVRASLIIGAKDATAADVAHAHQLVSDVVGSPFVRQLAAQRRRGA